MANILIRLREPREIDGRRYQVAEILDLEEELARGLIDSGAAKELPRTAEYLARVSPRE